MGGQQIDFKYEKLLFPPHFSFCVAFSQQTLIAFHPSVCGIHITLFNASLPCLFYTQHRQSERERVRERKKKKKYIFVVKKKRLR